MLTFICDLSPEAEVRAHEYRSLRDAGEPVLLYCPAAAPIADVEVVADAAGLDRVLEDERLACLGRVASLPAWVPVADCHRVLLLTEAAGRLHLLPAEASLLAQLFAAGADEVELLPAAAANDLSQSWQSGRRAGAQVVSNHS